MVMKSGGIVKMKQIRNVDMTSISLENWIVENLK